jgi:AcrR family transcriptional regulator
MSGMSTRIASLSERLSDHTRDSILAAALSVLEEASFGELTVRAVASRARMSERTVFRYFASRDDLLDAVADEVSRALNTPPVPASLNELLAYPASLYQQFESRAALTKAALHTELFHRMRNTQAQRRWAAVCALIDKEFPRRTARERTIAAANIRYYLSASTWHYYRFYFSFGLEETIACARSAIQQTLVGLRRKGSDS